MKILSLWRSWRVNSCVMLMVRALVLPHLALLAFMGSHTPWRETSWLTLHLTFYSLQPKKFHIYIYERSSGLRLYRTSELQPQQSWGIGSGESKGNAPSAHPPTDQNFLNFSENLANLYAGTPLLEGWRLLRGILDPPLIGCHLLMVTRQITTEVSM